jgi:biopolymer transport protein ExbD
MTLLVGWDALWHPTSPRGMPTNRKASKAFFFEKKNQKAFAPLRPLISVMCTTICLLDLMPVQLFATGAQHNAPLIINIRQDGGVICDGMSVDQALLQNRLRAAAESVPPKEVSVRFNSQGTQKAFKTLVYVLRLETAETIRAHNEKPTKEK